MSSPTTKAVQLKTIRNFWLVICAGLVLAIAGTSAYSSQHLLPHFSDSANDFNHSLNLKHRSEISGMHQSKEANQHHEMSAVAHAMCQSSACDSMPDCTDGCATNTCCSYPGVSIIHASQFPKLPYEGLLHPAEDGLAVLSRRPDPLFRPPIV
jgi:hypothetical protein